MDGTELTCLNEWKTYVVLKSEDGYVSVDCCVKHMKNCNGYDWRASRFVLFQPAPVQVPKFMRKRASVPSDGKEV